MIRMYTYIYRSPCPLCTDLLPALAATAHGAAQAYNRTVSGTTAAR